MSELVIAETAGLDILRSPQTIVDEARGAAKVLTDVISQKKKPVKFNGEQYLEFEDWQTIAKFYGVSCRTYDPSPIKIESDDGVAINGAKAHAELVDVKTGRVVGSASAWCLRDEPNWRNKPWYQLGSMAQTRAGSKAMRNLFSWVVVLAGYKTTPAEEMTEDKYDAIEPGAESRPRVPADSSAVGSDKYVGDILGKLIEMAQGDEDEAQNHLRMLTEYDKDGKANWVKITDLDRIAKSNPKWINVIHSKVVNAYNKWKIK